MFFFLVLAERRTVDKTVLFFRLQGRELRCTFTSLQMPQWFRHNRLGVVFVAAVLFCDVYCAYARIWVCICVCGMYVCIFLSIAVIFFLCECVLNSRVVFEINLATM